MLQIKIIATRHPKNPNNPLIVFKSRVFKFDKHFTKDSIRDLRRYAKDLKGRLWRIAGSGRKLEVQFEKTTI